MEQLRNRFQHLKYQFFRKSDKYSIESCQFRTKKWWLNLYPQNDGHIRKPDELENEIADPPDNSIDDKLLDHIQGSLIGMALGDALGAHVEFRPNRYLVENPVDSLQGGGTWGLGRGQFTDDTSMALCLASSLIARHGFVPYDQLVRYKWWYQHGYMSSIGECFDIGAATRNSLDEFMRRQRTFSKKYRIPVEELDYLSDRRLLDKFDVHCSKSGVAGNGALMRLAPVPLFFHQHIEEAIEFSGYSGKITHGDTKAYDACRYFGALILAALHNFTKDELLDTKFLEKHGSWFGNTPICDEIRKIAEGSYRKPGGYADGIRGKGYIVNSLEAALWAFWSDENSFEKGVLAAVNLGDDTDTTAAIYGQLAGAFYGYEELPKKWILEVCGHGFILKLSKWIAFEGKRWNTADVSIPSKEHSADFYRAVSIDNILVCDAGETEAKNRSRIASGTRVSRRHSMTGRCALPASNKAQPISCRSPYTQDNKGDASTGRLFDQDANGNTAHKTVLHKFFKWPKKRPPNGTWTPKLPRKDPSNKCST